MNKKASFLFEIEQLMQKAFDKKALDKEGFLYLQSFLESHKLICSELLVEDKTTEYTPRMKRLIEKIKSILEQGINDVNKLSVKLVKWLPNYKIIDTKEVISVLNDLSLSIIEDLVKANHVNKKRKAESDDLDEISPNKRIQQGSSYKKIGSSLSSSYKSKENGYSYLTGKEQIHKENPNSVTKNLSADLEYFIAKPDSSTKLGNADYGTLETDVPAKIIGHTLGENQDPHSGNIKQLAFQIEWSPRKDGFLPISSYYAYDRLKEKYSKLILHYFENVIQLE